MNKTIYLLSFLLVFSTSFRHQKPPQKKAERIIDKAAVHRIDSTLKSFVDGGTIAGVSALVFEKNKEVYYNAYGFADLEAKRPMNRKTVVRIYSMTKPITGVALMTLYEQGAFQLDDPLSKYAPEFAHMQVYKGVDASGKMILEPAKRPITIRDLTRHTSGFAVGTELPGLKELVAKVDPMNPNNTLHQMAKNLASLPLAFHPGEQWAYGCSVDVQAYLVELLSRQPFDKYIKEKIFDPLQMNHTGYLVPEAERKNFAVLYRKDNGKLIASDDQFNTRQWPLTPGGFGLTSTLDDYMKFARMLVNKGKLGEARILKPQTVQLMSTSHLSDTISQRMWLPSKGQVGFGIDFAVRTRPPASAEENNGVVGEFFWDGAASTLFWVDPVNEITAVLFLQVMPFYGKLHKGFRDAVYGPVK